MHGVAARTHWERPMSDCPQRSGPSFFDPDGRSWSNVPVVHAIPATNEISAGIDISSAPDCAGAAGVAKQLARAWVRSNDVSLKEARIKRYQARIQDRKGSFGSEVQFDAIHRR